MIFRILIILLVLCSTALAQVPMTGAGTGAPSSGATGLVLDGSTSGISIAFNAVQTLSLTTTNGSGQIIVCGATPNAGITSVTAPGLTFNQRIASGSTFGYTNIEIYSAPYTTNFSGTITITWTGTGSSGAYAFGIGNANTTAGVSNPPFDAATGTFVTNGAISLTTTHANDFIFVCSGTSTADTYAGAGNWTSLGNLATTGGFISAGYQIVSATQTSLSGATAGGSTNQNGAVMDAVRGIP